MIGFAEHFGFSLFQKKCFYYELYNLGQIKQQQKWKFCSVVLCQRFHLCIRIATELYGREGIVESCAIAMAYVNGHIYKDLSRGTHFAIASSSAYFSWEKNHPHFARNKLKVLK